MSRSSTAQIQRVFFMNRTARILFLVAALLAGTLELHPREAHTGLAGCQHGAYSRSARHPQAPAHFESTDEEDCPLCPVCLHHLRTGAARLPFAALLAAPSLAELCGLSPLPLAGKRFVTPRGARGPPFA
jgi:hypothetical protein